MPIIQDSGSSGGGSTTSICTPSPSDNLAILNNLLSRLSDVERFLSLLVGADVYANNLSELAKDLGNVINGTITLPQTGYIPGGSVPVPDDFTGTFVSGNVVTIWENGTVRYEITPSAGVVVGNAVTSYLVCIPSTTVITALHPDISTIVYSYGNAFDTSNLSAGQIDILESGYYHISVQMLTNYSASSGHKTMSVSATGVVPISALDDFYLADTATDFSGRQDLSVSFGAEITAGQSIIITFSGVSSLSTTFLNNCNVTVEKLRSL